jgi:hypothetical protein
VIIVTDNRADALARLDVFIGDWSIEARFPGHEPAPSGPAGRGPMARSRFEWALGGQFLLQRFTGTFSEDGNTITGAWEKCPDGVEWEHDFALTYRRAGSQDSCWPAASR